MGHMIYRRKDPPDGGMPLIELPARIDHIQLLSLSSLESLVYDYVQKDLPVKSIFARLIRLRQGESSLCDWSQARLTNRSSLWSCLHPQKGSSQWRNHIRRRGYDSEGRRWLEGTITGVGPISRSVRHKVNRLYANLSRGKRAIGCDDANIVVGSLPLELGAARELFRPDHMSTKMTTVLKILNDIACRFLRKSQSCL